MGYQPPFWSVLSPVWACWSHPPKTIVSTCRKIWCLSTCKKSTWSLFSFLRNYTLKNPANWLAKSILVHNLRARISPDKGLWWKINNNVIFHFRLFPEKTVDKFFSKMQKAPFWLILPISGQNRICLKILFLIFFVNSDYESLCQV